MSTMELVQRAHRKYEQDGAKSLWTEGKYTLFESKQFRSVLKNYLIDRNSVERIDYDDLCQIARSTSSFWNTFDDERWDSITEPIPTKMHVPETRSFDRLETSEPVSPAVMEIADCTLIHPFGLTLCKRGILQETIAKSAASSSRIEKALSKSVSDHGYREINNLITGTETNSLESLSIATPLLMLWNNYYHWSMECLPRLAGVERYRQETGNEPSIIIPEDPSSWMLESLRLLGIKEDQLHELETHCTVDRLVVPTHPGPTLAECQWLRDRMYQSAKESSTIDESMDHRIYVSRQSATRRRATNEDEVVEMLRSYGFERYALEELSVADQVIYSLMRTQSYRHMVLV
ncbi:DUF563 domain-containing protein [Halorubrum sp. F4]|uniref:glycosyltransferase family 61 protein n=1 Tax=Halorubrum sp. F4 TaxID=2989715 RepID=UPI0034E0A2D8